MKGIKSGSIPFCDEEEPQNSKMISGVLDGQIVVM
jgi:hypothetical protein